MPVKKAITELQYQASEILSEKNKHSSCRDKSVSKVLEIQVEDLSPIPSTHTQKSKCGWPVVVTPTLGRQQADLPASLAEIVSPKFKSFLKKQGR